MLNFCLHARILSDLGLQQSCTCGHNCYECVRAVAFLLVPVGILVPLLYPWEYLAILVLVVLAQLYTGKDYCILSCIRSLHSSLSYEN